MEQFRILCIATLNKWVKSRHILCRQPETPRNSHVAQHRQEVDPIIGDAVGSQLKSLFEEFASEAVPDKFMKLIAQLEQVEAAEAAAAEKATDEGGDT
jgi:hypothetical protein